MTCIACEKRDGLHEHTAPCQLEHYMSSHKISEGDKVELRRIATTFAVVARIRDMETATHADNKPTTPCSRHDLEDHDTYFTCRKCGMHFSDSDVVGD
jgi:hypothetical protein